MILIDADELISILEWNKGREKDKLVSINSLIKLVRARPTAYDVDKVLEQLEYSRVPNTGIAGFHKVVETVKGGGIK